MMAYDWLRRSVVGTVFFENHVMVSVSAFTFTLQPYLSTVSAGVGNQLYFADLYMKLAFCFVQSIYLLRCWFAPPFSAIAFIPKGRGSEGRYHADSSCRYYYRSCGIVDQTK